MKKIVILFGVMAMCATLLFSTVAMADTTLTATENQPAITTFRIERFLIDAVAPAGELTVEFGYDSGGFVVERRESITVTNEAIYRNRRPVIRKDEGADPNIFDDFPAAYQTNPATELISQVNGGTFGGQGTLKAYLEATVKTLLGL